MILPEPGRGTAPEGRGGGGGSLRKRSVYAARKLRRQLSLPEALLWRELRGDRLGHRVRRQHPIGPYVADFCAARLKLVIEVDGEAHNRGTAPQRDAGRDDYFRKLGFRVLRVAAGDVLRDMDAVLALIAERMTSPLHQPSPLASAGPPPRAGEDL